MNNEDKQEFIKIMKEIGKDLKDIKIFLSNSFLTRENNIKIENFPWTDLEELENE